MYYLKRIAFFLSSYIPLFFILFFANLKYTNAIKNRDFFLLFGNGYERFILIFLFIFILSIIVIMILNDKLTKLREESFSKDSIVASTDHNFLNYFGAFIIPLTTFTPSNLQSLILNFLLLISICIFYVQNDSYYYNLFAMGFKRKIFKDQFNNYYISDYSLTELKSLISSEKNVKYKPVTNKIQIILKKYNA